MATRIIVVPDVYFRNWDETGSSGSGEMWVCLRPVVETGAVTAGSLGDLTAFDAWARSPHLATSTGDATGAPLYEFKSPNELNLGLKRCDDTQGFLPINLPSDIDVTFRIGRKGQPEVAIKLVRSSECLVSKGGKNELLGPYSAASASPFSRVFNEDLRLNLLEIAKRPDGAQRRPEAIFTFMQQMEAGRRIEWLSGRVKSPFKTPGPALEGPAGEGGVTSQYWFLGLMAKLGDQKDLPALRAIDRVDIILSAYGKELKAIPFPGLLGGDEDAAAYFSRVGDGFKRSLGGALIGRENVVYVAPGFRGLQKFGTAPHDDVWLIERPNSTGRERAAQQNRSNGIGALQRLAAIEVRDKLEDTTDASQVPGEKQDIGTNLHVMPGLLVEGALKPYRRFPNLTATGTEPLRATVMTFEPDATIAPLLEGLWRSLPAADFKSDFRGDAGDGWTFKLLHAGILPWDGPHPLFRVVAIPPAVSAGPGQSLTLSARRASLFFPALAAPDELTPQDLPPGRCLWTPQQWSKPGQAVAPKTPKALQELWETKARPKRAEAPFNAVRVRGVKPGASVVVNLMLLDDFQLQPAESSVRLEKVLRLSASAARTVALTTLKDLQDPLNFDPLRDYEDDLVNLNTVRVRRADNSELDEWTLRSPQRTEVNPDQCIVGDVARNQTIPLLHAWQRDPLDVKKDEQPASLTWLQVRSSVGERYGLLKDVDATMFHVEAEHTYGDRLSPVFEGGASNGFRRSQRLDWPVQVATFAERQTEAATDASSPFVICEYQQGATAAADDTLVLTFDKALLALALADSTMAAKKDYAVCLTAWRALAELACPQARVSLQLDLATFSLELGLDDLVKESTSTGMPAPPQASVVARRGFHGGWGRAVSVTRPGAIENHSELARMKTWAESFFKLVPPDAPHGVETFRFSFSGSAKLGTLAHLLRVNLRVDRDADRGPVHPDQQHLTPISQQPGLYVVSPSTMQGAWAAVGFGPLVKELDATLAGPVWNALGASQTQWTQERTWYEDSVSPRLPPPPPKGTDPPPELAVQSALISALEGSDWFAPAGDGPKPEQLIATPVVTPVGFAPCRPHATLQAATQTALERLCIALRDTVDLAFPSWTLKDGAGWEDHFGRIAALCVPDGDAWTGPLPAFAELLTTGLLFPQPHPEDPGNAQDVRTIAKAVRGNTTADLGYLKSQVRQRLISDPSLFADAKGLLLTALRFAPNPGGPATPPPGALARARFGRVIDDAGKKTHDDASTTSIVTLDDLALTGGTALNGALHERLGFLEVLDDTAYDNEFLIAALGGTGSDTYVLESYEQMVDPKAASGPWPQARMVLPLVAANQKDARRVVHLASRKLVSEPIRLWTGESSNLLAALAATGAPKADWSLEYLSHGAPGAPPTGGTPLTMAARMKGGGSAPDLGAERGIAYALFAVTGDEEQPAEMLDSFHNDSFFLRLTESAYERLNQPRTAAAVAKTLGVTPETALRTLLTSAKGSKPAAEAIESFVLSPGSFADSLKDLIVSSSAEAPAETFALLRIPPPPTLGPAPTIREITATNAKANATLEMLQDVVFFKPKSDSDPLAPRTGYLLIGFKTEVWAPLELEFSHGRNLPLDRWGAGSDTSTPRFAPEFWQTMAAQGPASRYALSRSWRNAESRWKSSKGHRITLDSVWRKASTPRALLEELLLKPGRAIDTLERPAGILTEFSRTRLFRQQISIQVWAEQFLEDPTASTEPISRYNLPLTTVPADPAVAPAAKVWFPPEYNEFSLDLHWYAPSGSALLMLDRIFVRFDGP